MNHFLCNALLYGEVEVGLRLQVLFNLSGVEQCVTFLNLFTFDRQETT